MKEHKSHMSMVARFAYIFATIVTIFAQMGAAVPAMTASADSTSVANNGVLLADKNGYNVDDEIAIQVNAKTDDTTTLFYDPSVMEYDQDKTEAQHSVYIGFYPNPVQLLGSSGEVALVSASPTLGWPVKVYFKVKKSLSSLPEVKLLQGRSNSSGLLLGSLSLNVPGKMDPAQVIDGATGQTTDTTSTDTSKPSTDISKPSVNNVTADILNLASTSSPDSNGAYKLGSEVDLHLNADPSAYPDGYNDIQVEIKELDTNGNSTTDYLTFDPDATAKLLRGFGYTVTGPTKGDGYSAYSIRNDSDGTFFNLWVYADHNIRIQWPKGTTGPNGDDLGAWFAMRANKPTDGITMTPYYVGVPQGGGDLVELDSGPATTIKIAKPNGFEGSDYSVDAHSITADDPETKGIVHMNLFPLFYIQDPDDSSLYSFVQNHNAGTQFISGTDGLTAITQYRKSVIDNVPFPNSSDPTDEDSVSAGWGGASVTGANLGGTFEDFAKIQSDGQQDTTTLTGFKTGKTYQLKPVRPYGGANSNRFYRIKTDSLFSQHYYMPDGLPTISFEANGDMQIDTKNADGKAKKGQWTVSDDHKKLEANVYKIKYIQIIDDETGAPVDGANVELTNTDGGEGMKATTKSYNAKNLQSVSTDFKGTGELQPEEYQEDDKGQGGPFYLPEGTEHLSAITGLSSEYSAANVKFDMSVDSSTDKIILSNAQNAKLSEDGQTIIVTVHKDVPKNTEVNIQKVAQSDGKALASANFEVTEKNNTTNDAWTTPAGTTLTSGADGMVPDIKVDGTSSAKTRTFLVKEAKAPTGYGVSAVEGYYATWTKGTGFTAVGNTETKQSTKSEDGLASVNTDGTLVIEDPTQSLINPGGKASDLKFQYINAAGEPISGAQLPVLDPTKQYGSNDALGMTSVGGIIYNPSVTDPTTLMTKDSGLVAGTTIAKNSIMDTSDQKSDENGQGVVQGLWSETGISENWKNLDPKSNAYLLSSAMVNGVIPTVPEMDYSLINETQQARAAATGATGYYSLGGTVSIGEDADGKLVAGVATGDNKFNANANDNKVLVDQTHKTAQVILFKVKRIALTDLNGTPIVGATVHFTNLVTAEPTDANGEADLVPSTGGADGKVATSFVWPKAKQSFVSATDAEGNKIDLGTDATKYGIWMGNAQSDLLTDTNKSGSTNVATNMTVSDGTKHPTGQFVELKSTTAQTQTVIRIHKQSMLDPTKSIEGVSFKVWPATDTDAAQSSNVVTTHPTNEDGDTTASFDAASTNGKYYIEETDLPDGIFYRQDTKQHLFTADVSGSVSAVDDTDKVISVGTNGALDFSDMPSAGGGGGMVGDNGTNGGLLTIKKTDLASPTTVVPDGAQFKLTETINNVPTVTAPAATVANGQVQINIGDPTLTTRQFTLQEVASPLGYSVDSASYPINIAANGTVTVGDPDGSTVSAKVTTNKVLSVNGYVLTFGDQKVAPKDGGSVTIKKVDDNGTTALPNAHFSTITSPVPNLKDGNDPLYAGNMVEDAVTDASGEIQVDLGTTVGSGRIVKFAETQAPNKYALNPAQYNIKQNVDGSIQVAKYESGTTPTYSDKTSDGKVSVVDGKVIVKDRKMTPQTDLGIKKIDITNPNIVLGGATFTVNKVDASLNPLTTQYTMKTTSDGEALAAITDGSQSGTYSLKETAAPDGYALDSTTYYFNWESGKGVTAVAGTKVQPTATKVSNSDGAVVLSTSNGELVFGDKKAQVSTATSFTLKKSDFSDSSKGLAGATFKIADATASGVPSGTYNLDGLPNGQPVTTGSDGTVKVTVNPDTSKNYSQWIFAVQETKAPAGYVLNKQIYYVIWTPKDGISGVSTKRGMPTPDEGSGIQLSGGIVNISDVKSPTVTIKKISSVNNAALAGANLTVAEFDKKPNTAYSDIWSDKLAKVNATTQSDGLFKFSPSGAIIGSLHYYKVVEETAPSGFKKGAVAWIVYKMGTGIVGVTSDPSTGEPGTSAGPLSIQNGTVVYTDQVMAYTIQVRRQSAPPTDTGLATLDSIGSAVKINFEDMTDNTGTHTVTTDATSGNVTLKASDIMSWLKLDTLPTSSSVKFKISVDADSAKGFTVPIPRYVTFTWGANGGFTVDKTAGKTDGMVTDSTNELDTKNAKTNTLSAGDLRVILRRDTFIAKAAAADPDTNVIPRVPNAQFVMNYYAGTDTTQKPIATSTITTSDKGVALIQAPNLSSDNFKLGTTVSAVLSQETATSGYEQFSSSITFNYTSDAGYSFYRAAEPSVVPQVIPIPGDPSDGQNDPDSFSLKYDTNGNPIEPPTSTDVALSLLDTDTGVSNQQYYYGGTQIIVPLTKILSSLSLDQAPAVLNFGQAHKSGFQQNLPLLGADASDQATFDTTTLGDEANAAGTKTADAIKSADGSGRTITPQNQQITAKVTQVGQYKAGWQLGLSVGGLTGEAVAGETPEVIDGGALNLGKATLSQPATQSQSSTKATESFALGGDSGSLISTLGTDSVAGTYTATWNIDQVTMSIPQLSGNPDTSYQAPLTWEVTEGPQQ